MKIQKFMLTGEDKQSTELREKILTIPIKPGLTSGTEILVPEAGDEGPTKIPADIIFVTEDRPHDVFKRDGSDLLMTIDLCISDALVGTIITINTIDERIFRVPITSVITNDYKKIIPNEGMPTPENPKERGSLIISFSINFPTHLTISSKKYLQKAFKALEASGEGVNICENDTENMNKLIYTDKMHRNVDDVRSAKD